MLKPIDIQKKEFEVKVRGYAREQVDDFLDIIMQDMATLYRDNTALVRELEDARKECEKLQAQAGKAEQAYELTKYQCEEMRMSAKREAKEIIDKAKADSRAVLYTIEDNKEKIKAFCQELLEKIDKM